MVFPKDVDGRLEQILTSIEKLSSTLSSPRKIATERIKSLGANDIEHTKDAKSVVAPSSELVHTLVTILIETAEIWNESIKSRYNHILEDAVLLPRSHEMLDTLFSAEEKKDNCACVGLPVNPLFCGNFLVSGIKETKSLYQALSLHLSVARLDPTLATEVGRAGSHAILSRLVQFDLISMLVDFTSDLGLRLNPELINKEEDKDAVMELQDLACEIGSLSAGTFPLKFSPFCREDLQKRLPMIFSLKSLNRPTLIGGRDLRNSENYQTKEHQVLINQVTARQSAQVDVGFGEFYGKHITSITQMDLKSSGMSFCC